MIKSTWRIDDYEPSEFVASGVFAEWYYRRGRLTEVRAPAVRRCSGQAHTHHPDVIGLCGHRTKDKRARCGSCAARLREAAKSTWRRKRR